VETLRQNELFKGRLVFITKEDDLPNDRPKLSKALTATAEDIRLRDMAFYRGGDVEVLTGAEVTAVSAENKEVILADGKTIKFDKLILATGTSPRTMSDTKGADAGNVFPLRTPGMANEIASASKDKEVVVVGTSFIGMEVAAYLSDKAAKVTVIGNSDVAFKRSLGDEIGRYLQTMHEKKNVNFKMSTSVEEFVADEESGAVKEVLLTNGDRLKADVVVMGVGVVPNTDFLKESDVTLNDRGYVEVNEFLETSVEDIFAAGDIARFPLFCADNLKVNIGHWQLAMAHGRRAGLNAAGASKAAIRSVPFFWTQQYGKSIRYAGYDTGHKDIAVDGDVAAGDFAAYYCDADGKVLAVATMGRDPWAADFANLLLAGESLSKEEALKGEWRERVKSLPHHQKEVNDDS